MAQAQAVKRVLICEDEAITAMALRRMLIRVGYTVIGVAGEAEQAVVLARQLQPDLILMDIGLFGPLSGIEAARRILQEQTLPIIMLTAYSDDEHVETALKAGACGYLVKPLTSEQLLPALEAAVMRFETVQSTLQAGELTPQRQPLQPCK